MNDNQPEYSGEKGQKDIDKDVERRNRENETGQAEKSVEEQAGQAVERSDTATADDPIVATSGDPSSDYLTKGEEETDFAEQGQGAPEPSAGRSDIENPAPGTPDAVLDEGSSAKP